MFVGVGLVVYPCQLYVLDIKFVLAANKAIPDIIPQILDISLNILSY